MRVRVGTAYFEFVGPGHEEAFAEGRRILGRPPLKEGEKLTLDKKNRAVFS